MTTNFQQTGNDLEQYLIPLSNKDLVPMDKRKIGTLWGSWGTLWGWGSNGVGQLGLSDRTDRYSPIQVGGLSVWRDIAAGYQSSAAIKTDGTLWTWGSNTNGYLGIGDTTHRSSPVQVGSLTNWKLVKCNSASMAAIKTDGTLWSWGLTPIGNPSLVPTQVGTSTDWSNIFSGMGGQIELIKSDGTLWSWGNNANGQLGLGDTTQIATPTQVGLLTNWSNIACGQGTHTMAIKTDGTLWAWGTNAYGGLGLGTAGSSVKYSSPVQVGSLTNWKQVACGDYHSVMVKTDGTLWVCGRNNYGQLGLNDITNRSSPVQVGTLTNWSRVTCGIWSSYGIKTDGTIWAWGHNGTANLGLGNQTNISSPVQVGTLTNWYKIDAMHQFVLGIQI